MSRISSGNTIATAAIITSNPDGILDIVAASGIISCAGSGAVVLPSGTSSQRPASPTNGMIRYSTSSNRVEGYANNRWVGFF